MNKNDSQILKDTLLQNAKATRLQKFYKVQMLYAMVLVLIVLMGSVLSVTLDIPNVVGWLFNGFLICIFFILYKKRKAIERSSELKNKYVLAEIRKRLKDIEDYSKEITKDDDKILELLEKAKLLQEVEREIFY